MACFVIFITFLLHITYTKSNSISHKTPIGEFHGLESHNHDTKVRTFYGIRYAESTRRERRFKEAIPHVTNINSKIDARSLPVSCPQGEMEVFRDFEGLKQWAANTRIDEDCLFLNIWQPLKMYGNIPKKPVIAFIHGGGFIAGSSVTDLYNGTALAAKTDAVVVSFQYRLGALGFLYTGDDFAPGNAGLKDQVLALKWVHRNIEHFGGDKDKITLIGFSAGSASVGHHLLSPETSKLFKRAVLLSATPNNDVVFVSPTVAKQRAFSFAAKLGANTSNYEDVKTHLTERRWSDFIKADKCSYLVLPFVPTEEPSLIPEHPIKMMKTASHLNGKEVIVSWTPDEGSFLLAFNLEEMNKLRNIGDTFSVDRRDLIQILDMLHEVDDKQKLELMKIYNASMRGSLHDAIQASSDILMICPCYQFIEVLRGNNATVYQLVFNYRPAANPWPSWAGTPHGSDIYMLFDLPRIFTKNYSNTDMDVRTRYLEMMKKFVDTGNPNVLDQGSWFKDRKFLLIDNERVYDNRSDVCRKLKEIMPDYLSGSNCLQSSMLMAFLAFITSKILL